MALNAQLAKVVTRINKKFAGLEPWEIADKLNEVDATLPPKSSPIQTSDARLILLASGELATLRSSVDAAAVGLMDWLMSVAAIPSTYRPAFVAAVEDAALAGAISADTSTALQALGQIPQSWADLHLGEKISAREVAIAKGAE